MSLRVYIVLAIVYCLDMLHFKPVIVSISCTVSIMLFTAMHSDSYPYLSLYSSSLYGITLMQIHIALAIFHRQCHPSFQLILNDSP